MTDEFEGEEALDETIEPEPELRPPGEPQAEPADAGEITPMEDVDGASGPDCDGERRGELDETIEPETSLRPPGERQRDEPSDDAGGGGDE